jgi:hypothetical protein
LKRGLFRKKLRQLSLRAEGKEKGSKMEESGKGRVKVKGRKRKGKQAAAATAAAATA